MESRDLKQKVIKCIDRRKSEVMDIGGKIYANPKTGFKEFDTAKLVAEKLRELGLSCIELEDIPGVKATIDTGREGPSVAILGELDAIVCSEHPDSDKETGAVHACGHNVQIASMLGAAMGILDSGASTGLVGKIHIIAVPAEEYIEVAYRLQLREKGIIRYLGGKPEFLHRGMFDDVDICIMMHSDTESKKISLESSCNGCIVKKVKYIGKASHAGGAPYRGINALYAANLGMTAINCIRETFREDEYIRVHPIITKGGDIVNVIPHDVQLETFVRGKTMENIQSANLRVNRALIGGAVAIGAEVEIQDIPGYFPLINDENLTKIAQENALELAGEDQVEQMPHTTGSTDLGDLCTLMPVLEVRTSGIEGSLHSADYRIVDPDTAYVLAAKLLASIAVDLLRDGGAAAKEVISSFVPMFKSKDEYFSYADSLFSKKVYPAVDVTE